MKSSSLSAAVMALAAAAICFISPYTARAASGTTKATHETYIVIEVVNPRKDAGGNAQQPYQVVAATQLKDLQKQIEDEYKTKTFPEWQDAVKIDSKTPRPLKPTIKRLKTFNTQKIADEYVKKLLDDLAAKDDANADKPKP